MFFFCLQSVNECPSPTMDMLLSASDSLSFQEMLDVDIKSEIDIKTEIDTVLSGHNDCSEFNFFDLPPLELDDDPSDINMWFSSNSNHSSSNFNIDFIGSEAAAMMVNPNSVMPLTLVTVPAKSSSPTVSLAGRNVKSPSPIKIVSKPEIKREIKSLVSDNKRPISKTIKVSSPSVTKPIVRSTHTENKGTSVLNIKNAIQRQLSNNVSQVNNGSVRVVTQGRKHQYNGRYNDEEKVYPKPAYSYSCLIAMALKNSRTGSLPVSEIYNFMW